RDLPGRDRQREVPRRDDAHRADRLAGDFHVHARTCRSQLLAGDAQRLAGEELEDLPGARGLADALGQGLAFLARQQPAQFLLARQDFAADRVEDVGALLRTGQRPRRQRRVRRVHRLRRLRGVEPAVVADRARQVRRILVDVAAVALDPLPGDVAAENLFAHSVFLSIHPARRVRAASPYSARTPPGTKPAATVRSGLRSGAPSSGSSISNTSPGCARTPSAKLSVAVPKKCRCTSPGRRCAAYLKWWYSRFSSEWHMLASPVRKGVSQTTVSPRRRRLVPRRSRGSSPARSSGPIAQARSLECARYR